MLYFISVFVVVMSVFLLLAYIVTKILKNDEPNEYDGRIVVTVQENGKKIFSMEFDGDPYEDLDKKEFVTFKVIEAEPSVE